MNSNPDHPPAADGVAATSAFRVGLLGAGFIARTHAAAWRRLGARGTVFSTSDTDGSALAERYGFAHAGSLAELLRAVDVVDICTPTDTHLELVRESAAAGRPVICEKPLARGSRDASTIVEVCDAANVALYPAHVVRFHTEYTRARQAVARGRIGQPAVLRLSRSGPWPGWAGWITDPSRSGGVLVDLMIHEYDIARWIAGPVVRVFARQRGGPEEQVCCGQAILTHASGAITQVTGAWLGREPVVRSGFDIAGSHGTLTWESAANQALRIRDHESGTDVAYARSSLNRESFERELAEFRDAILGTGSPRVTAADGAAAVRIAEAAETSHRIGRAVELEEAES